MNMFKFGTQPIISIAFNGAEERPTKSVRIPGGEPQEQMVLAGNETLSGNVEINIPHGKKVEHLGVKIEMIGQIELYFDKGSNMKFTTLVRELESAGTMTASKSYPFEFSTERAYESYSGMNARLRYFVRVTMTRNYNGNVTTEKDFVVQNAQTTLAQQIANEPVPLPTKLEVGIEDCLHIEFEYDRQKYHLQDVILGKIYFLLVRIKIKHMELAVIRREAAGNGPNTYNESENVTKYELMDGAPVKGECIPIRMFLSSLDLTPTYRSVNNTFSVKYYLNLVLVDEEDRRYFKQQEVVFWRKEVDTLKEV